MRELINKILCPTDGSITAEKAVDFSVRLAKLLDVPLTFLLVSRIPDESATEIRYRGSTLIEAANLQDFLELSSAHGVAVEAGVGKADCARVYARRNVAAAIIEYAEKEDFSHIVMGSMGRTGVSRILLGSVAADVVHKAHCPVTIVR
jgi:nucleotide-binding universal stress UspA family protein